MNSVFKEWKKDSANALSVIYLSGCCHGQDLGDFDPLAIRLYVEKQIRKSFPGATQIHPCWPKHGIVSVTMTLDPDTEDFYRLIVGKRPRWRRGSGYNDSRCRPFAAERQVTGTLQSDLG